MLKSDLVGLGLESSCDDTSAAVVVNGKEILSNVISSQTDLHSAFNGVVPEIASRAHLEMINVLVDKALSDAGITFSDIDYVSCTNRPGLMGSLMISLQSAKAYCLSLNIPLIAVSHIESHLYAVFLDGCEPVYPHIGLLISGGNTALYMVEAPGKKKLLGRTTDDAIGEAYDKIAKFTGLGYPGGPLMDKLARKAVRKNIVFPRILAKKNEGYDFSYSGLKTAVINYIKSNPDTPLEEVAYAFQESAIEILLRRLRQISADTGVTDIVVAGGVASNSRIRELLTSLNREYHIMIPPPVLCTDNAAMNAGLAYHYYLRKIFSGLETEASPRDESFFSQVK